MLGMVKLNWNRVLPFIFVALFALSRWPGLMPWDFSAAYALAFCGGVYFTRRMAWWLPIGTMVLTDVALNLYWQSKGWNVWTWNVLRYQIVNYIAYAAIIWLGKRYKPQSSIFSLIGGGVLG